MSDSKVLVGMSGGVDSTVAAHLLKEGGASVKGITFELFTPPDNEDGAGSRHAGGPVEWARESCGRLGIEHHLLDATEEFKREVVDPFVAEYRSGRTPNPCVICNEKVKFPLLAEAARRLGCELIATGHYARIARERDGRLLLHRAADLAKDQSYFLYRVPIKLLDMTLFPLGEITKTEAVDLASRLDLIDPRVRESQDTCFLASGGLHRFLGLCGVDRPGDVIGPGGRFLGRHKGVSYYTIGQRKGLGISAKSPLYVSSIDARKNIIGLGPEESIYARRIICRGVKMRTRRLPEDLVAKIRSGHEPTPVESVERSEGRMTVTFVSPQRAVTPGQSLVLYRGESVVGGGFIERAIG
jgi:tRNA-specific 2-thiouridylase